MSVGIEVRVCVRRATIDVTFQTPKNSQNLCRHQIKDGGLP